MFVVQLLSYTWLWNLMNWSSPGFSVLHCLLGFIQTHVHWVSDTIQPSHLLWPPSPPALSLSQHQNFFQWCIGASASASVLPMNIQKWLPLGLTGLISLLSRGFSRAFSIFTVWKHQFFGAQPSLCPAVTSVHDYWKNCSFGCMDLCQQSDVCFLICFLGLS